LGVRKSAISAAGSWSPLSASANDLLAPAI
jgi:hypothetical protein